MFYQHGIRKVKMDDIAKRLRISKRTVYEIYADKEETCCWRFCNTVMKQTGRK